MAGSSLAFGFSSHYLITDRALPDEAAFRAPLAPEALGDFLRAEKTAVARLFVDYYGWLKARGAKRFVPRVFDTARADEAAFLSAARLNPKTRFLFIIDLPPDRAYQGPLIPLNKVSIYDPEGGGRFRDMTGQPMTVREILSTFSDEPDWGMDTDMWTHPEYGYGYGQQPYGKPEGFTTQAPFHCQYSHENLIVRLFAPEVTEGMVVERLELMTRLARLAFKTGHAYWGNRFTGWALHYLQDVGQPYHSRAVPFADWKYYLHYAVSANKAQLKAEATQATIERHDRYEGFVRQWMEKGYQASDSRAALLVEALTDRKEEWAMPKDAQGFFDKITGWSTSHAQAIDRAVSGGAASEDDLLKYAAENLRVVGRATRAMIHFCGQ